MRKHIVLFFSALLFFTACKWNKTPAGIIKPDKMIALLTRVHLVDGIIINIDPNPDSLYKFGSDNYRVLFKTFHTDTGQFKRSLRYYADRPEQMETMYAEILKNLEFKRDSMNKVILKQNSKHGLPAK